jgi:hypothetical protein
MSVGDKTRLVILENRAQRICRPQIDTDYRFEISSHS